MKKSILSLALAVLMVMTLFTVGAFADGEMTAEQLQKALNDAASSGNKVVTMTSDVIVSDADLSSYGDAAIKVPEGVTLDGGNYKIIAENWTSTNQYHVVGVSGTTSCSTTTIENLTVIGNANTKSGVHAFACEGNVVLNNVTIKNCGNAAVQVNGSIVEATALVTSGNVWGAVNVDKGSASTQASFTLNSGDLGEEYKVWSEKDSNSTIIVPSDWVTVNGAVSNDYAPANDLGVNAVYNETTKEYYRGLDYAVAEAQNGDTIVLLDDAILDGSKTSENQGVLNITSKNIIIDGGSHTLTIAEGSNKNAHAVNIQANSNVTIKNITIDGANITKNGINVYQSTAIIGENVTVKNNRQHGVVVNGSDVTVDGLTTEGNGQGGINVDNKAGDAKLIVEDAEINETFSIKYEKTGASGDVVSEIKAGSFKIIWGPSSLEDNITVSGGTFTSSVAKYVSNDLNYELNNDGVYTYYPTLEEALDAAKPGAVIKDVDAPAGAETYTVVIDPANGGEKIELSFSEGMVIDLPDAPKNSGYIFLGWRCGDATYKAGDTVTVNSDMTFTAVWGNLPDVDPEDPEEPEVPDFPFYDVNIRDWYYDAVYYVWDKGLMDGVDTHEFAPNATLTRAMVWTIIARAEGVDTTGGATWYAKAQEWVTAKGISDGENPNAAITRQELVTMLYRLAGEPAVSGTITAPDASSVSTWAQSAMTWAMNIGLVEGDENGAVTPTATATRAQAAALIMRYLEA